MLGCDMAQNGSRIVCVEKKKRRPLCFFKSNKKKHLWASEKEREREALRQMPDQTSTPPLTRRDMHSIAKYTYISHMSSNEICPTRTRCFKVKRKVSGRAGSVQSSSLHAEERKKRRRKRREEEGGSSRLRHSYFRLSQVCFLSAEEIRRSAKLASIAATRD